MNLSPVKTSAGTIFNVRDDSAFTGSPFRTGWLAGVLYRSTDDGATWVQVARPELRALRTA